MSLTKCGTLKWDWATNADQTVWLRVELVILSVYAFHFVSKLTGRDFICFSTGWMQLQAKSNQDYFTQGMSAFFS